MPEGHTTHRLALDHVADLGGRPVAASSPQGRFEHGAKLIDGLVLEDVDAWGKHLFYEFEGERIVHVHLGLFGKFWRAPVPLPETEAQVRLRMEGETHGVDLTGPTACDLIEPGEKAAILARLGPDPLRKDADPERAWVKLRRRKGPIGAALMDQGVLAGIGNVYRAEVLFVHGLHPERSCAEVDHDTWMSIWSTLRDWQRHGVKDRVIITVPPKEIGKPRSRIKPREALYVYRQDHCRVCGSQIRRWDLAGRWAYACERCQRPPVVDR